MYEDYYASQLRALREELGYTQQELADILHTSKQVLSRYETGQRTPKISVANEIASILNVPLSYFLPNPPVWEDDIWEDYQRSRSDKERLEIVAECGLDRRAYKSYIQIISETSPVIPPFRVSDFERTLIVNYRKASPGVRESVEKLLDVSSAEAAPKHA